MKQKKLLLIVLTLVFVMALSACGEPFEIYDKIVSKYNKEEFLTAAFENKLTIKSADSEIVTTSSGKMERIYNDDYVMKVSGTISSSTLAEEQIEFEKWFADGKFFSNIAGGKAYSEIEYEGALGDLGKYGLISGITGEGFDAIIENPSDGGESKLDFIIKKHSLEVYGLSGMMTKIGERYGGECTISAISGNIIFDGSLPVSQKYSVSAEMISGEKTYQVVYDVNTTFDFDTEINLEAPGIDGYIKVNY